MNDENSDEDSSDKYAEISDDALSVSESDSMQEKELKTFPTEMKKRKLQDSQNMCQVIKKTAKGKETKRDKILEWNYFYSNAKFGIWIQCTKCKKWRNSTEYEEDHEVPLHWHCSMNVSGIKSCDDPEDTEGVEFSPVKFIPGSIVWAKLEGYPWWPGMIEDDPDTEEYYWIQNNVTWYNVTFLDDKVSHAWVPELFVSPYLKPPYHAKHLSQKYKKSKCLYMMEEAEKKAKRALAMPIKERLEKFSFAQLYKGKWGLAEKYDEDDEEDITEMLIKELEDIESLKSYDSDIETDNSNTQLNENPHLFSKNLQKGNLMQKAETLPIISQPKAGENFETDSESEVQVIHDYTNAKQHINENENNLDSELSKELKNISDDHLPLKRKKKKTLSQPVKKFIKASDNYNSKSTEKKAEQIEANTCPSLRRENETKGIASSKLHTDILVEDTKANKLLKADVNKKTVFKGATKINKDSKDIKKKLISKDVQASENVLQTDSTKATSKPIREAEHKSLNNSLGDKKEKKKDKLSTKFKPPTKNNNEQNNNDCNNVQNLHINYKPLSNNHKSILKPLVDSETKNSKVKPINKLYASEAGINNLNKDTIVPKKKIASVLSNSIGNNTNCTNDKSPSSYPNNDNDSEVTNLLITTNRDKINILKKNTESITRETGINEDITTESVKATVTAKKIKHNFKTGENEKIILKTRKLTQKHEDTNKADEEKQEIFQEKLCNSKKNRLNTTSEQDVAIISKYMSTENELKCKTTSIKNSQCKMDKIMNDSSNMSLNVKCGNNTCDDMSLKITTTQNKAKNVVKRKASNKRTKNMPGLNMLNNNIEPKFLSKNDDEICKLVSISNSRKPKKFTLQESTHTQRSKNYQEITENNKDELKIEIKKKTDLEDDFETNDKLENLTNDNPHIEEREENNIACNKTTKRNDVKFDDENQDNVIESQNSFQLLLKADEEETENEDSDPFEAD